MQSRLVFLERAVRAALVNGRKGSGSRHGMRTTQKTPGLSKEFRV